MAIDFLEAAQILKSVAAVEEHARRMGFDGQYTVVAIDGFLVPSEYLEQIATVCRAGI